MLVICLERGAGLHMAQLMPLPLTVSCFSKIQTGFTFLVPAHPDSRGKKPLNGCVCVSSLWNVYHNTKACFFDPPCMWLTSCSVQALSESEILLVWTVLQVERVSCLKWNCCRLKGRTSCDTCLVVGNLAHISTPWDRNRNQFSSVCTFSILDRNWWFFHIHSGTMSYNSVHLFLAFVENFAATVTLNVLCLPVK